METINPRSPGRLFNLTAWMPLLWLSLAFLAGILFAGKVTLSVLVWLILAGGSLVIFILFRILHARFHISIIPLLLFSPALLGVFFLGAARYQATIPRVDANYIAWYNDRDYQLLVTGTLTDPPDVRDTYTNLRVSVTSLDAGDQSLPVHGLDPRSRSPRNRLALWGCGPAARAFANPS